MRKTVRLRNLNFNGVDTGMHRHSHHRRQRSLRPAWCIIEDCLIDGAFAGGANGISDERTAGGELYISNSTVRNAGNFGIAINPPAAGQRLDAAFDNMRVQNTNNFGIFIGNNGRVVINRSVISGNVPDRASA